MDRPGPVVRGLRGNALGRRRRNHLPDRLPAREIAVGRQPLPVRADFRADRHPRPAAASCAVLGHRRRADHARGPHRPGPVPARALPLGDLSVRRPARVRGSANALRQGRGETAGRIQLRDLHELGRAVHSDRTVHDGHRIPRAPRRTADGHTTARGTRGDRDDRPDLRARLDPGRVRRHPRPVPRVHIERVRAARPALALFCAGGRHSRPAVPAYRPRYPAAVRRREDALGRCDRDSATGVAGRRRGHLCGCHRRVAALSRRDPCCGGGGERRLHAPRPDSQVQTRDQQVRRMCAVRRPLGRAAHA